MLNETTMVVDTVSDKTNLNHDRLLTVVLKGQKTVVHETGGGYEMEDTAEISMTVKCTLSGTLRKLGISEPGSTKVMDLRDRNLSLQSFEKLEPVAAAIADLE